MADPTVIGRATIVRGRVTGTGDLEIAGRVEGEVACSGEVLVDAGGLVGASISARRIVVRGAVKGDLVAEDAVVLESGARVVGDLRAPRIAIAQGGMVRGHVQTQGAGAARPRAAQAAASVPRAAAAAPAREERREERRPAPAAKAAPEPARAPARANSTGTNHVAARGAAPRGATLAGARPGPPPPVVPVLKKGTKATQKKR